MNLNGNWLFKVSFFFSPVVSKFRNRSAYEIKNNDWKLNVSTFDLFDYSKYFNAANIAFNQQEEQVLDNQKIYH